MTSPTDAPPPALGELARLATAELAEGERHDIAAKLIADDYSPAFARLVEACSPAVVLQLVALARQAEECWCGVYRCIHNDADAGHPFSTEHPRAARSLTPERPA